MAGKEAGQEMYIWENTQCALKIARFHIIREIVRHTFASTVQNLKLDGCSAKWNECKWADEAGGVIHGMDPG
jgi:hypothetical protein